MSRALERRLERVEKVTAPPGGLYPILIVAADDPDAERQIAEHEAKHGEPPPGHVSVIVLTGVPRSPTFGEW